MSERICATCGAPESALGHRPGNRTVIVRTYRPLSSRLAGRVVIDRTVLHGHEFKPKTEKPSRTEGAP
jgi:hypothetical protein